ncbi:MAG: TATA box binding protein [Gaeavirus sp.]|uniref:TATA box binding protein n=1 Tax=Gaeavirus sp. TaxID=2487767 RepID=A0A3G4ZZ99_9VIRU|nr:MAG: TATA box binding protein [Gaeavirus sp.]
MTNLLDGIYKGKTDLFNLPYDLEISTSTITCAIDLNFNVENIGLYFNDFDDVIIGKRYGNRIINNLISIRKLKTAQKKTKKEKKNFFNQVSLIFRSATLMGLDLNKISPKERTKTVNVKLFINGSIQMTGCKHLDNIKKSLEILFNKFKATKAILNDDHKFVVMPFVDDVSKLHVKNVGSFNIQMINTNFNMQFQINRNILFQLLLNANHNVSFDPIIHACVNIKYKLKYNPAKTISIFVFESGSITIAGSNSADEVLEAYNFINYFILTNFEKLLSKDITPQIIIELIRKME